MSSNDYGGLVQKWKVDLIGRRAKRLGFKAHEIADLEQVIVQELRDCTFVEGGPAEESTFVTEVIDHQLFNILRHRKRDKRRANYEAGPLEFQMAHDCSGLREAERVSLRLDIETAMAGMSSLERDVCNRLKRGMRPAEIARAYGRSRSWMSQVMSRLREKLRRFGLDEYRE